MLYELLFDFLKLIEIIIFEWIPKLNFKNIKHLKYEFASNATLALYSNLTFDMTFLGKSIRYSGSLKFVVIVASPNIQTNLVVDVKMKDWIILHLFEFKKTKHYQF